MYEPPFPIDPSKVHVRGYWENLESVMEAISTWQGLGLALLIPGALGVFYQCAKFVRKTLPDNFGNNPGFGCLEVMVLPWFSLSCIGAGLLSRSWLWPIVIFPVGLFATGFLATLLARKFRDR
jgi:hypothetical protein